MARQGELDRVGIQSANPFFSLGIYGKVFLLLISLLMIYYLASHLSVRVKKARLLKRLLRKKLFYNAWIRFLITSNLKITHNAIFVLHFEGSFTTLKLGILTSFNILLLAMIVLWPLFLTFFLMYNRKRLERKSFQKRFHSMYLGNRTLRSSTYLYHTVFCLRRLFLVLAFYMLHNQSTV